MKLGRKLILYYLAATLVTVSAVGFAAVKGIERLSASTVEQQLIGQSNLAEIYVTQIHLLQDNDPARLSPQTASYVIDRLGLILGYVKIFDKSLTLLAASKSETGSGLPDSENNKVLDAALKGNYAYVTKGDTVYFASPVNVEGNTVCLLEIIYPMGFLNSLISGVTNILFVGVIAFILIMTLLSAFIARRMTKRVNRLARAAGNYANRVFEPVEIKGSDEISSLSRSFNEMGSQLQDYIQRQKQFVSNVSHELRTPLTAIRGYSEILADELPDDPDLQKAVSHLKNESERLSRLVDEVLTLSRIDAERETFEFCKLDLSGLVADAAGKMNPRAEKYEVTVALNLEPGIMIVGDREKLIQVVVNLLDNAFKFSPRQSTVRVILDREGDTALLSVIDEGIGIPEADAEKVFERFYRAGNARGYPGTGLGLSIVKFIVEGHKGTIGIRPGFERGTAVDVRIPIEH